MASSVSSVASMANHSPTLQHSNRFSAGSASRFNAPTPPRFGCRLEGAMVSEHSPQRDQFIKAMAEALPAIAEGAPNPDQPVNAAASLLRKPQKHGWGFAFFDSQGLSKHVQRAQDVRHDGGFASNVDSLPTAQLTSGVIHARVASDKLGPKQENTHPFRLDGDGATWTFVHNGQWDQSLAQAVKDQLRHAPGFQPKGDTDSEHAFLYLMHTVKQQLGSLNSQTTGEEAMIRAFAKGIRELTKEKATPMYKDIPSSPLGITGKIMLGPSHNFVANDGNLMIAYRKGQSLYLGVQNGADGKPVAHSVATVPRAVPGTQWFDVQEDTMVIIHKDPTTGESRAELRPLGTIPDTPKPLLSGLLRTLTRTLSDSALFGKERRTQ